MKTACFTGPRPEKLMKTWNEFHPEILRIKHELFQAVFQLVTEEGYQLFLCGMARGTDLLAAEAVAQVKQLLTHVTLAAVIPYRAQRNQQSLFWKKRYDAVLQQCEQTILLQEGYSPSCLIARNRYMVNHSSCLVAVDNDSKTGGTAFTLRYAKKQGLHCKIIHTSLQNDENT